MVSTRHHPNDFSPPSAPTSALRAVTKPGWSHTPSTLVTIWLLVSNPVVLWDASYMFLRPHSMPGGSLHTPWTPYALYGTIDYLYGWPAYNSRNGFSAAQSALNLVECVCYIFYLVVIYRYGASAGHRASKNTQKGAMWLLTAEKHVSGRMAAIALLVVFSSCIMTVSKTVMYGLIEAFSGFQYIGHNDVLTLIFLWIVPNGFWIVFPSYAAYFFGREILGAMESAGGASQATGSKES
ncbi:hypothetical protein AJ80_09835 [Polytolypa hystricis UAMH7299]|uniref:EXPERA domain-containing protein n=1 Tax=Polytolypa hystricis (strain UAMH7299) TaxID=1447883 RepID=A0A2B7WIP2_POLH7|nr:hypothetical protein AJ80_09835 [Polytolypa hystricis UAMH7299]